MQLDKVSDTLKVKALESIKDSKTKVSAYKQTSEEILNIIKELIYNNNLDVDKNVFKPEVTKPKLNIYIAYDEDLYGEFNNIITNKIKEDIDSYKIIIGGNVDKDLNSILKIKKEEFKDRIKDIEEIIDAGLKKMSFSEINLNYIYYESYNHFSYKKVKLFPFAFNGTNTDGKRYICKTDSEVVIKGLLSFYILHEIIEAEENSRTSGYSLKRELIERTN